MRRQDKYPDTEYFTYYNANPKNRIGGDCVIRAIATALNQTWEDTLREMTEFGIKKGLVLNDTNLYPEYLKNKGFKECCEPRGWDNKRMTVKTFCHFTKDDCIVAKVGTHHVTCIINRKVLDVWDCTGKAIHKYWVRIK